MKAMQLKGRTALVTGASQGIGEGIVRLLGAQGAKVIAAARSVDKLESLSTALAGQGVEVHPLEVDLAAPDSVAETLGGLPESFSQVDILVNNAGITEDGLLARMTLEAWEDVLRVNLTGAFVTARAVSRGMMRRRWGRIINISSVVGLMGNAGQANYAAAKAGLVGFSKSLARELASRNVTVNVVAPGFIETAMTDRIPEKHREELVELIPLKRLGSVDDVAWAVLYLASEQAGYVTGHVLNVSGGLYI